MPAIGKQSCPTCGQSTNKREISVYRGMVNMLYRVWQWCESTGVWHDIRSRDVFQFAANRNESVRFADWRTICPSLVGGRKGYYSFSQKNLRAFFTGKVRLACTALKNPLTKEITRYDHRYVHEVANLGEFLNENEEYIAQYR